MTHCEMPPWLLFALSHECAQHHIVKFGVIPLSDYSWKRQTKALWTQGLVTEDFYISGFSEPSGKETFLQVKEWQKEESPSS